MFVAVALSPGETAEENTASASPKPGTHAKSALNCDRAAPLPKNIAPHGMGVYTAVRVVLQQARIKSSERTVTSRGSARSGRCRSASYQTSTRPANRRENRAGAKKPRKKNRGRLKSGPDFATTYNPTRAYACRTCCCTVDVVGSSLCAVEAPPMAANQPRNSATKTGHP